MICSGPYIRGLDVGCGANFIYPLLGAGIYGWSMSGCDVTDVALTWSKKHVGSNPHLSALLDVRDSRPQASGSKRHSLSRKVLSGDVQPVYEGTPASLGGEGEDGQDRRPAVRRTLHGRPRGKRAPDEGPDLEAEPSCHGAPDSAVGLVESAEAKAGERNPERSPLSSSVGDAEPGIIPIEGGGVESPSLHHTLHVDGCVPAAASNAAGHLLAQALPSMVIGENPRSTAPTAILEIPIGPVLVSQSHISSISGDKEAQASVMDSSDGRSILMPAMKGTSERFTFCM